MLSGYIMMLVYGKTLRSNSWKSIGKYYWARLARIYPLHLAVLLILIGLEFAATVFGQSKAEPFTLGSRSVESIWTSLLLVQAWHLHTGNTWNIPSWSISCEWAVYLMFPFLVTLFRGSSTYRTWGILTTCVASLIVMERWYGSLSMSFDWGVARCLGSFVAGAAVFELLKRCQATDFSSNLVYVSALCLPVAMLTFVNKFDIEWPAVPVLLLLLGIMSKARCSVRRCLLENRPMFFLGELSYAIYISHWIVQATVPPLFVRFIMARGNRPESAGADAALLLAMIGTTFAISYALHNLVEKPARTRLRNIFQETATV